MLHNTTHGFLLMTALSRLAENSGTALNQNKQRHLFRSFKKVNESHAHIQTDQNELSLLDGNLFIVLPGLDIYPA